MRLNRYSDLVSLVIAALGAWAGACSMGWHEGQDPAAAFRSRAVEGSWTTTANMSTARALHTATVLIDDRVLVTGGITEKYEPLASAELYDPVTETWSSTTPLARSRDGHSATLLPTGSVLVAGGSTAPIMGVSTSELYDPSTESWSDSGDLVIS